MLVEQLSLTGAAHERLVLHLTVHVDQRFPQLAQRLRRHRAAIDKTSGAAVAATNTGNPPLLVP